MAFLYLSSRKPEKRPADDHIRNKPDVWPLVTIQLPIYNECLILDRLIKAVVSQNYPRDRFEVQVLDDSTDETTQQAQDLVDRYRNQGWDISLVHRNDRVGYKAGALNEGMKTAKGEFIGIFDADFMPGPDWLRQLIPDFADPKVGCVQSRWGHTNTGYNMLTGAEALGLDGHFMVEQNARSRSHLFMGFNGSGGIWRRKCMEEAGGWQSDTLTEDLDLSYRAQLKGWRIYYRDDIVVPGELPAQVDAFKNQQYRWAKGSAQTFRKLGKPVLTSKTPWYKRVLGIMHLSMYMPFPFMVGVLVLTLPVALYARSLMNYFGWTMIASLGPPLVYTIGRTAYLPRFRDRLLRLPALLMIGLGVSLNSSFAVLSGLFTKGGVFNRTPKFNIRGKSENWAGNQYALPTNPVVWGELFLGAYSLFTVYVLWHSTMGKALIPGVFYYAISYFFIAFMSIGQSWQMFVARSDMHSSSTDK